MNTMEEEESWSNDINNDDSVAALRAAATAVAVAVDVAATAAAAAAVDSNAIGPDDSDIDLSDIIALPLDVHHSRSMEASISEEVSTICNWPALFGKPETDDPNNSAYYTPPTRRRKEISALINEECCRGGPTIELDTIMYALFHPERPIDYIANIEWVRWLIAGGRTPYDFVKIGKEYILFFF